MKTKSVVRNIALVVVGAVLALVALVLIGMSLASQETATSSGGGTGKASLGLRDYAVAPAMRNPAYDTAASPESAGGATTAAGDVGSERVIKTAELEMQVKDATVATQSAKAIATAKNGFVLSASVTGTEKGERTAWVSLRVPVAQFEATVTEMKKLSSLVISEQTAGQDVTEEYADLESQIRNAQAEEAQYQQVMKQATKISDILEVTSRLAEVRGRIERLQGRRQFLTNRTDYSTVSATMSEEPVVSAPSSKWRPLQVASESLNFLVAAFETVVNMLIAILIVGGGLLLPIAIVGYLIYRLVKRAIRRFLK